MLFPTPEFAVFLAVVVTLAALLRDDDGQRKGFLVLASYVFYGWWSWKYAALLAASSCFAWACGLGIAAWRGSRRGNLLFAFAVTVDLSVLGWFKYIDFGLAQANAVLEFAGFSLSFDLVGVAVPVGVSFFTFHAISYVADLRSGRLSTAASLRDVLLYEAFFPQLVAGPIVRASSFLPQLASPAGLRPVPFARVAALIIGGLFKKVVLAPALAAAADPAFSDPASRGAVDLAFAAVAYSMQILCDFSAYTDIAIGVALLLGYEFPLNFNRPYSAVGFRDFWRRWHVSLSSWLRDYLYVPLGGGRGGFGRTAFALMATMLLGGLWHGAAWNFVLWGCLHGTFLVAERAAMRCGGFLPSGAPARFAAGALTFCLVTLAWIPFRSPDLSAAIEFMAGFGRFSTASTLVTPSATAAIMAMAATQALPSGWAERSMAGLSRLGAIPLGVTAGVIVSMIMAMGPDGVPAFIYFQF
jgi:D-alanyl-lipoteichoic acid acyltransferase DltB (MBOAT superfamily)